MLAALAISALSVVLAAGRFSNSTVPPPPPVHASLKPSLSSYLGVFKPGAPPSYEAIANFSVAAGRKPALAGFYSGWAAPFDTAFADMLHSHGVIPYVQIDPTDASVAGIAAGTYDDYLKTYADAVRNFRHPVVIGFGHEMNAPWFSWGYKKVSPATFKAAWRHLVEIFRAQGAGNVTWLWTVEAAGPGVEPAESWWPGDQFVSWVGIDNFYYRSSDTFDTVFGRTITQIRTFTTKPILLSETAVAPAAGQYSKIINLFKGMASDHTLGLVWFDFPQSGGGSRQDWAIENNPSAEVAFKFAVRTNLTQTSAGA